MSKTALMPEPYIHYETTELGLVTFLHVNGISPIKVDHTKPARVLFHFELTDEQRDLIVKWFDANGKVRSLAFGE